MANPAPRPRDDRHEVQWRCRPAGHPEPHLTKEDATKVATAITQVRRELLKHPPYTTRADYSEGEWTVHFEVEEEGAVGGRPVGDEGQKEIARVGADDDTSQSN